MSEKKTIHFISHTHWDREWYMPFEAHRHQLIRFFDRLLDTLENEPEFRSFHLDGQAVMLEDYLEVRPQKRALLEKYIAEGRVMVGPWYILQDEYLIDGESNLRNMLYGLRTAARYGPVTKVGYFPDAFGNISQAPQILRGFGIDCAALGRGVSDYPAYAREGKEPNYGRRASEIVWRSPDGSEIIGAVFLHWYNNASEIPADPEAARARIAEIQRRCESVSAVPHLLAMNGCDHQPVQRDIGAILGKLDDYPAKLVHSDFAGYFDAIRPYKERFSIFEGELDGDFTNGMGTLANTASARIYLKQFNHQCETLLERRAEPLSLLASLYAGTEYPADEMRFAWKSLLKNHPHDSICGCSVDEVHTGMVERFKGVRALGRSMTDDALRSLSAVLDTSEVKGERAVTVFNPNLQPVTEAASVTVDYPREKIVSDGELILRDGEGVPVAAQIEDLGVVFDYDLPDDRFRQPYYVRRFRITFTAEKVPALGWKTYALARDTAEISTDLRVYRRGMENRYLKITLNNDGSVTVKDKKSRRAYITGIFEDTGDIGNEYNYAQSKDGVTVLSTAFAPKIRLLSSSPMMARFSVKTAMRIPSGADLGTDDPQCAANPPLAKMRGIRTGECVMEVENIVTLRAGMRRAEFETVIENNADNHRVRVLTVSGLDTELVEADTPFDIVSRTIQPWEGWTNPSRPGKMQTFFRLSEKDAGLTVAGRGLCEYEVLRDERRTMALTLHRGVHQLGDWGVFPTPDAQCRGTLCIEYALLPFAGQREKHENAAASFTYAAGELTAVGTAPHAGSMKADGALLGIKAPAGILFSALKQHEDRSSVILRLYSIADEEKTVKLEPDGNFSAVYLTDMNEERQKKIPLRLGRGSVKIGAHKIVTLELVK